MKQIFLLIILIVCGISCKNVGDEFPDQFQITGELIEAIRKNDSSKVLNLMGAELSSIGRTSELQKD